jgi:hypothetical protein
VQALHSFTATSNPEDFDGLPQALMIECRRLSVMLPQQRRYLVNTNLVGTINCLEHARVVGSA